MVVTNIFKSKVIEKSLDAIESELSYVAVGDGIGKTKLSSNSLYNEVHREEVIQKVKDVFNKKITLSLYLTKSEANGYTLREVGTFNDSSGGLMFSRNVINDFDKNNTLELWIDIEFIGEAVEVV